MNYFKFLFVCSANKQRSKTAEDYFSEKYPQFIFLSAGTNFKICNKEGTNSINEEILNWADIIFVMEKKHQEIVNQFISNKIKKIIVILNIKDVYKYYQKN